MPIRCPACGRDNRDTANFCVGCGQRGLQALVSPESLQPQPLLSHAPQPLSSLVQQPPASIAPQPRSVPVRLAPRRVPRILARGPILEGVIAIYNQDEVYLPPGRAPALAKMGLGVAVLPVALSFFAGLGLALLVIIVLGGSIILAVFGAMIGAFAKLFSLLMPRRRPEDHKTTQVHLVVQEDSGAQSAVVLYGDLIAGMLHTGDIVAIYGHRARSGLIRATRVEVLGANFAPGAVMQRVVKGRRPFPPAVAAGVWIVALIVWGMLYLPLILRSIR